MTMQSRQNSNRASCNGSCNESLSTDTARGPGGGQKCWPRWAQRPLIRRLPGLLIRASQVRILPGAPQNSGDLMHRRDTPPSIYPIRGTKFHCTRAPRGIVGRILWWLSGREMPLRPKRVGDDCANAIIGWRGMTPPSCGCRATSAVAPASRHPHELREQIAGHLRPGHQRPASVQLASPERECPR